MNDETPQAPNGATVSHITDAPSASAPIPVATPAAEVEPNFKEPKATGGKTRKSSGATKAAGSKKAGATKKAAAKKASGTGVVRRASTVSKEGTQKDEFDGKVYPITNFPTVRQADGSYVRGTVTRANLPAWRDQRKAERVAKKAAADKAKAAAKAAKAKEAAKG
jgi:hypothetical protein